MIKVCHITSVHPAEDVRIFQKECVSLAKAGYDVTLVQQGESYEKNGVHILGFGAIASNRLQRMLFTSRNAYRKALAADADIYHLHDPELLPYGLKLKRRGKKVIFDSHEMYRTMLKYKPYLPKWACRLVAGCYGVYEDYILRRIDGLVFPSLQNGKNPFEGKCRRFAVVNNVPRLEEIYDQYDETVPKQERSAVYIGVMTYNRGITHFIRAAAQSNCTAYLGGDFSTAAYQTEVESLPEFSCAAYLGRLSRPQVLETLQRVQVGMANILNVAQYNQYDNLATKVYEYMSAGLPVILTDAPYNRKLMEEAPFGICVDPENVAEIAAALQYLFSHPEEAHRMGAAGRQLIRERFNWDIEANNLLRFYEEITGLEVTNVCKQTKQPVPFSNSSELSAIEKQVPPPPRTSIVVLSWETTPHSSWKEAA